MGVVGGSGQGDAADIEASWTVPERFGAVFDRHAPAIIGFIARRVAASDVEDVAADTFITAFRNRQKYDLSYPDAGPWLYGIATNIVRHHRRSEARRRRHSRERPLLDASEPVSDADVAGQVEAMVTADSRRAAIEAALVAPYSSIGPIQCPTKDACVALGDSPGNTHMPVYTDIDPG